MIAEVGSKGKVIFKAPYDIYNKNLEWTIVSIQTIPLLKAFSIDVLKLVYQNEDLGNNKLSESDYESDINANISIIAFANDSQEILYIPANRVDLSDTEYSYEYIEKGLAIPLPSMPVNFDLNGLISDIKILIKEKITYDVNVEVVPLSGITLVNDVDNKIFFRELENSPKDRRDYRTKFLEEVEKNSTLIISNDNLLQLVIKLKKQIDELTI